MILMLLVAFFYYQQEKRLYYDLTKSKMQNIVSKISSQIILSHMNGNVFNKSSYLKNKNYELSFYNEKKRKVFGNLDDKIDFSKTIISDGKYLTLIDSSTVGHLGIEYIVIKDYSLEKKLISLRFDIILMFVFLYSFISLTGIYLAKLFIKPIKEEREKLNRFIKDTTHELNTPISALLMSTEKAELTEKQVERIKLSAKRVSEIYKDLTYIFLQDKQNKFLINEEYLGRMIKEQLVYFDALASKKRIKIITEIEDFKYKINRDDFIRLFNNLLSNAIKYNKVGGEIKIVLSNMYLKVSDTGIGIKEDKQKDIFKRYFRATQEQGGFGIGLNIVSSICKQYKIAIFVNSQEKVGTSFILKFK